MSSPIRPLTKTLATQHIEALTALANQIPQVHYTPEEILSDTKGERQLLGKWEHSFVVLDTALGAAQPIAFIMGYERAAENTPQYPASTLYISELAVAKDYQHQGLARTLLKHFIESGNARQFIHLTGPLNYSVQTNAAPTNAHVRKLYESYGFNTRATKPYDNRVDVVMGMTPENL